MMKNIQKKISNETYHQINMRTILRHSYKVQDVTFRKLEIYRPSTVRIEKNIIKEGSNKQQV